MRQFNLKLGKNLIDRRPVVRLQMHLHHHHLAPEPGGQPDRVLLGGDQHRGLGQGAAAQADYDQLNEAGRLQNQINPHHAYAAGPELGKIPEAEVKVLLALRMSARRDAEAHEKAVEHWMKRLNPDGAGG